MQFGICRRAHARRITQPDVFAHGRQIEIELLVVIGEIALKIEISASAASTKLLDVYAVPGERQRSVDVAQAARQAAVSGCAVLNLNSPLWHRVCERASHTQVHGRQAGSGQIGIEHSEQLQVRLSVGGEVQFFGSREMNRPLSSDIRAFADQVRGLNLQPLIGIREPHRALVMQFGVFHVDGDIGQITFNSPLRRKTERTFHSHVSAN